jgi:hypothetical protein
MDAWGVSWGDAWGDSWGGETASTVVSPIAYNPAALAAYYASRRVLKPEPKYVAPDEWAVDFKIPPQSLKVKSRGALVLRAEACPLVRLRMGLGGRIVFRSTGGGEVREGEKHYAMGRAGIADIATIRKRLHRERAAAEESRLVELFQRGGATLAEAVGVMVKG